MKEKAITNQILKYLKSKPECFAFKVTSLDEVKDILKEVMPEN